LCLCGGGGFFGGVVVVVWVGVCLCGGEGGKGVRFESGVGEKVGGALRVGRSQSHTRPPRERGNGWEKLTGVPSDGDVISATERGKLSKKNEIISSKFSNSSRRGLESWKPSKAERYGLQNQNPGAKRKKPRAKSRGFMNSSAVERGWAGPTKKVAPHPKNTLKELNTSSPLSWGRTRIDMRRWVEGDGDRGRPS